jgi:hypothetical protein
MPLLPLLAAGLLLSAQPDAPERSTVPLIECPYWPLMFGRDATRLRQSHRQQLDQLISMVRQFEITRSATIVLGAYVRHSDQARWSERRIRRVRAYILGKGILPNRISVAPASLGERDILAGGSENPEVSYVVYKVLVPVAERRRIYPRRSPIC